MDTPDATKKSLFVTVGTTQFDELVSGVLEPVFLELLSKHGFSRLILQHGRSLLPNRHPPTDTTIAPSFASVMDSSGNTTNEWIDTPTGISIQAFPFKPSLQYDMQEASRIISHAGSGCILEALYMHKELLVVVNSKLMNNHQLDLASVLQQQGHLYYADSANGLAHLFETADFSILKPFPKPDRHAFMDLLSKTAGLPVDGKQSGLPGVDL
ncbi:hypothetical protein BASA50_002940 [Batrachochytrium salamandrivorans]|uniref:UDP-N-acetylglucosamine transferase subunit ALG13 n=1 Tax=Batrachochytrium salamandrivorans TaxID=1357716 RepID=A0ABQ8FJZ4_9FUNG|nr:hypothetical protein BASA62_000782 [Batrachochytrium salamandrivorans]KAH6587550.1 hypothetical protein BASA61_006276 [Batrachochytrium salamandrivorans]KAH6599598.1 hypothetical protein BASA50_002940 [Batrachochytrium salamandrivorans]KAH9268000.1 hypothetical protein BASA84_000466 [Batrachochytrium salamandrivorans]KAJ1344209.1 hypothetical protein BSLG_001349 [Batrachochytrium salamandrivorans]